MAKGNWQPENWSPPAGWTLVASIPQVGGYDRMIYARSKRAASRARRLLRDDPAMIDFIDDIVGWEERGWWYIR